MLPTSSKSSAGRGRSQFRQSELILSNVAVSFEPMLLMLQRQSYREIWKPEKWSQRHSEAQVSNTKRLVIGLNVII